MLCKRQISLDIGELLDQVVKRTCCCNIDIKANDETNDVFYLKALVHVRHHKYTC